MLPTAAVPQRTRRRADRPLSCSPEFPSQVPSHQRARVLVVEDDEALALAMGVRLHDRGYDVITTSDGARGLRMAREQSPDLVILDLGLPGMNGLTVARILLSSLKTWDLPVMLVTGDNSDNVTRFALEIGVKTVIHKPLPTDALLREADRLLSE